MIPIERDALRIDGAPATPSQAVKPHDASPDRLHGSSRAESEPHVDRCCGAASMIREVVGCSWPASCVELALFTLAAVAADDRDAPASLALEVDRSCDRLSYDVFSDDPPRGDLAGVTPLRELVVGWAHRFGTIVSERGVPTGADQKPRPTAQTTST